jgi:hypothetical protein
MRLCHAHACPCAAHTRAVHTCRQRARTWSGAERSPSCQRARRPRAADKRVSRMSTSEPSKELAEASCKEEAPAKQAVGACWRWAACGAPLAVHAATACHLVAAWGLRAPRSRAALRWSFPVPAGCPCARRAQEERLAGCREAGGQGQGKGGRQGGGERGRRRGSRRGVGRGTGGRGDPNAGGGPRRAPSSPVSANCGAGQQGERARGEDCQRRRAHSAQRLRSRAGATSLD